MAGFSVAAVINPSSARQAKGIKLLINWCKSQGVPYMAEHDNTHETPTLSSILVRSLDNKTDARAQEKAYQFGLGPAVDRSNWLAEKRRFKNMGFHFNCVLEEFSRRQQTNRGYVQPSQRIHSGDLDSNADPARSL